MSIENVQLYHENNFVQKKEVLSTLEEYAEKIQWTNNGIIIDIGSGDGETTANILTKYIPANYKKLLGCDISANMVKFANEHYSNNRTTFIELDIAGELPEEMKGNFSHAFSFFVFHRIIKQEKAFENVYNLLTERGDCLLLFVGHSNVFESMRVLAQQDKWSSRLANVERYLSPYQNVQKPENYIKLIMEKIGFKNIVVKLKNGWHDFDGIDALKNMLKSVNVCLLPPKDLEDFIEDLIPIALHTNTVEVFNDNSKQVVRMTYDLVIVYGNK